MACSSLSCVTPCYNGNTKTTNCIKLPINSEGLAPYVKIFFPAITGSASAGGATVSLPSCTMICKNAGPNFPLPDLTVGNQSNPPNNFASIKSFQYGASDGNGAELEIYDEEGGAFDLFVSKLVQVFPDANDYGCSLQWGWIVSPCSSNVPPCLINSSMHYFLIISVNISYSAGGIVFKLELLDMMEPLFQTRIKDVIGRCDITDAITTIFKETIPPIKNILFLSATAAQTLGGSPSCGNLVSGSGLGNQTQNLGGCGSTTTIVPAKSDLKFQYMTNNAGVEIDNPTSWPCDGMNPLAAVREWLNIALTADGHGTIMFWNSASQIPQLIIMENPLPDGGSDITTEKSIGTYIVNGGSQSCVLSFDPQIKFTFATAANAGGGMSPQTTKVIDPDPSNNPSCEDPPGSGDTTNINVPDYAVQIYGTDSDTVIKQAITKNELANKVYENIEAELKIQGDPSLDNPFTIKTKTISIWVINPFHLVPQNASPNNSCPIWTYLNGPPCNPIMSNQNWFIKGVSHEIKEGTYTTTLKLYLPTPGCQATS